MFLNNGRIEHNSLKLWLKRRPYHGEFVLKAVDAKDNGPGIPLNFSLQPTDQQDVVLIEVPQQELVQKLPFGRHYRFTIHSFKHPTLAIETSDPLFWKPQSDGT
jgi:hypothetical protein